MLNMLRGYCLNVEISKFSFIGVVGSGFVIRDKCGTHSGYQAHRNYNEKPCSPCLDARNEYKRQHHALNPHMKSAENKRYRETHQEVIRYHRRLYRARKRGVVSEKYTQAQVIAKWGPFCHICFERVDLSLPSSEPFGLHLDHVIPLFAGGHDTLENVKPAHNRCNTSKGKKDLETYWSN